MDEHKINLIKLYAFLEKAKELVQSEGLVGGHRGVVDDLLTDCVNIVYSEIYEKE